MKPKDWNRWQHHKMICKSKGYRKDQGIFSFRLLSNHEFLHMIIDFQLSRYSLSLAFRKHIWESFLISSILPKRAHKTLSFVILRTHQTIILIRIHLWYGVSPTDNRHFPSQESKTERNFSKLDLRYHPYAFSLRAYVKVGGKVLPAPRTHTTKVVCINWIGRLSAPSWLLSVHSTFHELKISVKVNYKIEKVFKGSFLLN